MTRPDWTFDADGDRFRLLLECARLQMSHCFERMSALNSALIEPLPHQILAVYEDMLPRQPLRFLLADDPGAGKTIMAGLLMRELITRGDARRCLVCAPGNLVEQWQDELRDKFLLDFDILTSDLIARHDNPFAECERLIIRLDQAARSAELQARLRATDWDIVIVDEAHKMSASYFGNRLNETKRYRLGKLLGGVTRHLLLMTATPHNGKADDFELFLRLLDADRFAGRARGDTKRDDVADLMRRMSKESLLTFEGKPLFPERRAYTVDYELSAAERELYEGVTEYVRVEFDRAEQIVHGGRRNAIGFALTVLQRRLASSPAAIYRSLQRRREKLQTRLDDSTHGAAFIRDAPRLDDEDWNALDDLPGAEAEAREDELASFATAAQSMAQLAEEIATLERLETQARQIQSGERDRKWQELLSLLHDTPQLRDADNRLRKLVIFTEHKDTLDYIADKLQTALGYGERVATIHGGLSRGQRRAVERRFAEEADAQILVATDAAGEGINLQCAHLMVNYDLPWNPNRLEQRFGRIHRIGQREVCHVWNLLAGETREGAVYRRLLDKLATERDMLGGQVFDVLGKLFNETPLRELLVEALRYGDDPARKQQLMQRVDQRASHAHVRELLEDDLLVGGLDAGRLRQLRRERDRARAERLQPHYVRDFFLEAFRQLGGVIQAVEAGRFHIAQAPQSARSRRTQRRYPRVCFDKAHVAGSPRAQLITPSHALFVATCDALLARDGAVLDRGAVLVDEQDGGMDARALLAIETAIGDGTGVISRRLHFVEMDGRGVAKEAGPAPHLDYRSASDEERARIRQAINTGWLEDGLHDRAESYARESLLPAHFDEINSPRLERLDKTEQAVRQRLHREIRHWDSEQRRLRQLELDGKTPRISSQRARQWAIGFACATARTVGGNPARTASAGNAASHPRRRNRCPRGHARAGNASSRHPPERTHRHASGHGRRARIGIRAARCQRREPRL